MNKLYPFVVFMIFSLCRRMICEDTAELYKIDGADFYIELLAFCSAYENNFLAFPDLAKFILTKLSPNEYPLLQFFTTIVLVLPLCNRRLGTVILCYEQNQIWRAEQT